MTFALIKALGDYELLARLSQGDSTGLASELLAKKDEVDSLFQRAEDQERLLGPYLGFAPATLKDAGLENLQSQKLQARWETLKQSSPDAKNRTDQYDSLVGDIRGAISHVGDTSNLTLDPEMDTYYLCDVTSVTASQSLSRIASARISLEAVVGSLMEFVPFEMR